MTTNYENSKKLAEIGFKANAVFFISGKIKFLIEGEGTYPSYDLETLLDALPAKIEHDGDEWGLIINLYEGIMYYETFGGVEQHFDFHYDINESLADTAARLIVKLHEAGIINFKQL